MVLHHYIVLHLNPLPRKHPDANTFGLDIGIAFTDLLVKHEKYLVTVIKKGRKILPF